MRRVLDGLARWVAVPLMAAMMMGAALAADDPHPIRLGLQPTNATLSLLTLYHPLRLHLQRALGQPVELYTSRTFHLFLDQVTAEEFDILVAAPHFGVIALDHGYLPLLRYQRELRPLILVGKTSPIRSGADLKGRRVLTADRLTAVSVVAERWLEQEFALTAGRDYELVEASNHLTAIRAVALGDAEAAITTQPAFTQAPADIVAKVVPLPCPLTIPGQFFLAHSSPKLPAKTPVIISFLLLKTLFLFSTFSSPFSVNSLMVSFAFSFVFSHALKTSLWVSFVVCSLQVSLMSLLNNGVYSFINKPSSSHFIIVSFNNSLIVVWCFSA